MSNGERNTPEAAIKEEDPLEEQLQPSNTEASLKEEPNEKTSKSSEPIQAPTESSNQSNEANQSNRSQTTNSSTQSTKNPKGIAALMNSHNREPQTKFENFYSEGPKPIGEFFAQPPQGFSLPSVDQISRESMVKINADLPNNQNFPVEQSQFLNPVSHEGGVDSRRHAMDFLHKVRMTYIDFPEVYNNFLEIMKSVQQEKYRFFQFVLVLFCLSIQNKKTALILFQLLPE